MDFLKIDFWALETDNFADFKFIHELQYFA